MLFGLAISFTAAKAVWYAAVHLTAAVLLLVWLQVGAAVYAARQCQG